ncbi:MAG TPA: dTDP-4-dehydrorhamnose 3,5-epimerase [Allosphingosinicella sp.]
MNVLDTGLSEVKLIEPKVFGDERGFFVESWNARSFAEAGIDAAFVQDNHSRSAAGVLRGLHYQLERPQGKLVRVVSGRAFDVAVDIRRSSPRFGRWTGVELSAENKRLLWVPPGFAHGFLALEDGTDFLYKCTEFYAPEHDRSILWSDPRIAIEWPLAGAAPSLSAKDRAAPLLAEAEVYP